jgi:hypothetical protein
VAIPEQQLTVWAKQGTVPGSKKTYDDIAAVLEDGDAPYSNRKFKVFLQGSYRNDTNVYAESDVDVVIRLDAVFYYDISALTEADQGNFRRTHKDAEYNLQAFKTSVTQWLAANYGQDADPGNKAAIIAARGSRRKADVLICAMHRRYFYQGFMGQKSVEGVKFVTGDNRWIVNYPILHSDNLTTRHQTTREWLKPTIRIFKNMRNRLLDDGHIPAGSAPSYFIEGMLANVPDNQFGPNYPATVANCLNWLWQTDRSQLWCANGQHRLLADNSPTSWAPANCTHFLQSAYQLWNGS